MEELIEKAQKGDKIAFTKIIHLIDEDLYKIARIRISNEADIEDAIQETMIETYKSIKKLKDPQKLKKWVIKILINKCNRIYRCKYKKDISLEESNVSNYIISNTYKEVESNLNFYSMLKNLKYKERIIIVLYYMEEYSVKEIKQITGMNENTINTYLHRARKKIKNNFEKGE